MSEYRAVGAPTLLTEELQAQILYILQTGTYQWVAAQACGIDPGTFQDWMRKGNAPDAPEPYATFAREVNRVHAIVRANVESNVAHRNPEYWLTRGPGRSKPGRPGWTDAPLEVEESDEERAIDQLSYEQLEALAEMIGDD